MRKYAVAPHRYDSALRARRYRSSEGNGDAADGDEAALKSAAGEYHLNVEPCEGTYGVVVVAADGLGVALVAGADADDGDGRAVEAEEDVNPLHDDAEQSEKSRGRRRAGLLRRRRMGVSSVVRHWRKDVA